jgi:hypothetical protein
MHVIVVQIVELPWLATMLPGASPMVFNMRFASR